MKQVMIAAAFMAATLLPASAAKAAEADWYYNNNPGGFEVLVVGDLQLSGTTRYCGSPGNSYAHMRRVLSNNAGLRIKYWIDHVCNDGYIRLCIKNIHGAVGCSTYELE